MWGRLNYMIGKKTLKLVLFLGVLGTNSIDPSHKKSFASIVLILTKMSAKMKREWAIDNWIQI